MVIPPYFSSFLPADRAGFPTEQQMGASHIIPEAPRPGHPGPVSDPPCTSPPGSLFTLDSVVAGCLPASHAGSKRS